MERCPWSSALSVSVASRVLWDRVDGTLRSACGTAFTGAVARIEHRGRPVFERAYGVTRDDEAARAVFVDTPFDLASLSKLFTATLALRGIAEGTFDLDASLLEWFPKWRGTKHDAITLRMLLAHDSGMNSGADYRQLLGSNIVTFTLERELVAEPAERVLYSDLGFIAIGELLQRAYGLSLAAILARLRAGGPAYNPPRVRWADIPATEDDGWRGRVQGFVHDEKAYLLGGVAGHAGIFGTAADVAWLAEAYLGALNGRAADVLPPALVAESLRQQAADPVLRRGLGWALKTNDENSCGRFFSIDSFGHTGFVGTCVWADPARDVQGVLLTNAVYFGRSDTRDLRARFYEGLIEDLDLR